MGESHSIIVDRKSGPYSLGWGRGGDYGPFAGEKRGHHNWGKVRVSLRKVLVSIVKGVRTSQLGKNQGLTVSGNSENHS